MRTIRVASLFAWLIGVAGCPGLSSTKDVECDGGWVCPDDLACGNQREQCVAPDLVDACAGKAQDETCTASTISGICRESVCTATACGNGYPDPGEVCDDGNLASADGCRGDCLSDELCGNGVADIGEACDDGNLRSHDGCNSSCTPEQLRWSKLTQLTVLPPTLTAASFAYDNVRHRLLALGRTLTSATVFEWDGAAWIQLDPATLPSSRTLGTMAYDAAHRQIVLFGGVTSAVLGDTWLWDGQRWTEHAGVSPPARAGHVMVYDPERQRVVMFGGSSTTDLADTWEWDGAVWHPVSPALSPPATSFATAAYDPQHKVTVVVHRDGQTWTWNGTTWTFAGTGPTLVGRPTMTYAPSLGKLVLFRSIASLTTTNAKDTEAWVWDGTAWSLDATLPLVDHDVFASYFDEQRAAVVTIGSTITSTNPRMWAFEPSAAEAWSRVMPAFPPGARALTHAIYDVQRARVVMFGGFGIATDNGFRPLNETWELAGGTWHQAATAPSPGMYLHAMAYDERRHVTVVLGSDNKLYEYNGTAWTTIEPAGTWPASRTGAAMAYDRERRVVVMFGGRETSADVLADTWLWDGSEWREAVDAAPPPAQVGHVLAYDSRRKVIVMFGGSAGSTTTWEWDGAWHSITVADAPPARINHGLTYDPNLGKVVLFSGQNPTTFAALSDTWTWDGHAWARSGTGAGPATGSAATLVYEPMLAATVAITPTGVLTMRMESAERDELCGANDDPNDLDADGLAGCADPDCWSACTPTCPPESSCL